MSLNLHTAIQAAAEEIARVEPESRTHAQVPLYAAIITRHVGMLRELETENHELRSTMETIQHPPSVQMAVDAATALLRAELENFRIGLASVTAERDRLGAGLAGLKVELRQAPSSALELRAERDRLAALVAAKDAALIRTRETLLCHPGQAYAVAGAALTPDIAAKHDTSVREKALEEAVKLVSEWQRDWVEDICCDAAMDRTLDKIAEAIEALKRRR